MMLWHHHMEKPRITVSKTQCTILNIMEINPDGKKAQLRSIVQKIKLKSQCLHSGEETKPRENLIYLSAHADCQSNFPHEVLFAL